MCAIHQDLAKLMHKGAFKNYVDRRGWVGGQSNVYESKYVLVNKQSTRGGWSKKAKNLSM